MGGSPNGRSGRSQNGRELEEVEGAAIIGGSQKYWRVREREGARLQGSRNGGTGMGRRARMGGCHDGRESEWKEEPEQEETGIIGGNRNMRKQAREQGIGIGSGKGREVIEEGGRNSGSGSRIAGGRSGREPE